MRITALRPQGSPTFTYETADGFDLDVYATPRRALVFDSSSRLVKELYGPMVAKKDEDALIDYYSDLITALIKTHGGF